LSVVELIFRFGVDASKDTTFLRYAMFLRSAYCKAPRENFPPPFAGFCMPFARHVETSRAEQKPAQVEAAKNRDFIDFIPRNQDF